MLLDMEKREALPSRFFVAFDTPALRNIRPDVTLSFDLQNEKGNAMARHKTWVNILSDFVRENPRTSAMIAFNLGVWAGQATQKKLGRTDLSELPSKFAEMMPSMKEIGDYVPALPSPLKRRLPAALKSTPAKPARRPARKPAAKRTARRRTAKRKAA